jgi:hypothetical protein
MKHEGPDATRVSGRLGISEQYHWRATPALVDMSMPVPEPRPMTLASEPQNVRIDLRRTAIVVIDMQNDFCTKGGWVAHLGGNYEIDRAPIAPLQNLLPALRSAGVPVVWVNWGNRPDLANMPPNQLHLYKPTGTGIGLGEPLPEHGAHVLEKDSWAAAVVDELAPEPGRAYRVVRRREHRPMRIALAHGCELSRLWMRAARGLLCDVVAGVLHRSDDLERQEVLRVCDGLGARAGCAGTR